jgi:hypothetical protein
MTFQNGKVPFAWLEINHKGDFLKYNSVIEAVQDNILASGLAPMLVEQITSAL